MQPSLQTAINNETAEALSSDFSGEMFRAVTTGMSVEFQLWKSVKNMTSVQTNFL